MLARNAGLRSVKVKSTRPAQLQLVNVNRCQDTHFGIGEASARPVLEP